MITLTDIEYLELLRDSEAYGELLAACRMSELDAWIFREKCHRAVWDKPIPVIPESKNEFGSNKV